MNSIPPFLITTLVENLNLPNKNRIEEACRIFHGRGHAFEGLNHITIDWLNPVIFIILYAPMDKLDLSNLAKQLNIKLLNCKSIQVQHRYVKDWKIDCILGEPVEEIVITENDLKFKLNFKSGANTGLFLDMKNGRNWVKNNCKGKHVLNLFSYTCGFSVAAIEGEATSVYNVDISSSLLNIGRKNHRINRHDLNYVKFEKLNILKSFGRIKKRGPYDLIICDPPTFQKGSINLAKDYPKLIRRLKEFLNEDGLLFLCINTPHINGVTGREFLQETVRNEANELVFVEEVFTPKEFVESQNKGTKILIYKKVRG